MWNFYYEERDSSLSYQEVIKMLDNAPEKILKLQLIEGIVNKYSCLCIRDYTLAKPEAIEEDEWDEIIFDKCHEVHVEYSFLLNKLLELNIDFQTNFKLDLR